VVLSGEDFNRDNDQSVLLMITTGAGSHWPSDIDIADCPGAGLSHQSVVRWKAFTLPNLAILRRVGRLGGDDRMKVRRTARRSLAPPA
jgi:mRNA interferase MazF